KGGMIFLTDITRENEQRVRAQRLADLVDFSPISIIETTPEARIVSWNAGAERVYGYKASEIIGQSYSRLVPLDKLPEVQNQVLKLLKGEPVLEHETVRVRKDRESIVTWCSASPLYDESHKVRGFALVTRDVTKRKMAPLSDVLPEAVLLTLPDGTITGWNAAATRIFGYAREAMLGKNVMALFPPEGQMDARALVERARFGESLFDYDAEGRSQSGQKLLLSMTLLPSRDAAGTLTNLTLVARDVTELKQAEERISQLTDLVDASQEAVVRDDLEGRILYWNKAAERIYGYSAQEVLGQPFSMLIPEEQAEDFKKVLGYIKDGRSIQYEGVRRRKDGTRINIRATLVPLRRSEGDICGASIFIADVTEQLHLRETLRKQEEMLRQVQKMEAMGRLASGVAHDFNNWLMVLKGNLYTLEKEILSAEGREAAQHMREVVKLASDLTRQLLLFGRGGSSRVQGIDLNEALMAGGPLLKPLLGPAFQLKMDLAASLPPVGGDPSEFQQIMMNLVVNARDAMPRGGAIEIRSGMLTPEIIQAFDLSVPGEDPWVYLQVRDQGEGMDAEVRRHLFEPFFTTKPEGKGTGLGLAQVYGLVGKYGGRIGLQSQKGAGTTFTLAFPAWKAEKPA
ncbi:MAG TPA: PAS domain S-box protein, partial [bacterium]|nr:PAS domain S-box protein [bacterium]